MFISSLGGKLNNVFFGNKAGNNKGFSLVEVLVSIAILGIVSSMVATLLVTGTNFFRRHGDAIDTQNDSQLIETSLSTAIVEGTEIHLKDENIGGKSTLVFTTGKLKYVWVKDSGADEDRHLYVYGISDAVTFAAGNMLSANVSNLKFDAYSLDDSGAVSLVSETNRLDYIEVSYTIVKDKSTTTQVFKVNPRNTNVSFKKD